MNQSDACLVSGTKANPNLKYESVRDLMQVDGTAVLGTPASRTLGRSPQFPRYRVVLAPSTGSRTIVSSLS